MRNLKWWWLVRLSKKHKNLVIEQSELIVKNKKSYSIDLVYQIGYNQKRLERISKRMNKLQKQLNIRRSIVEKNLAFYSGKDVRNSQIENLN
jgi:hypothetical protein